MKSAIFKKLRVILAEFIATTLFVYTGCGSVYSSGGDKLTIALAFGLSITSLAYTVGHVSGGHMNPIVTIAMCILGQLDLVTGFLYIVAQLLGAMTAAVLLSLGMISHSVDMVVNQVNDANITPAGAFVMEVILSFLLVYVVSETAVNKNSGAGNCAPIAIGVAVFMAHIVAIPFTGCSINPARSFGPAVVSGNLRDLWMFVVAPITGGVLGALTARFVFGVSQVHSTVVDDLGQPAYDRLFTPTPTTPAATDARQDYPSNFQEGQLSKNGDVKFPVPTIHMAALTDEDEASTP